MKARGRKAAAELRGGRKPPTAAGLGAGWGSKAGVRLRRVERKKRVRNKVGPTRDFRACRDFPKEFSKNIPLHHLGFVWLQSNFEVFCEYFGF
jgi:hypothetical protein